jgi:hypothetical protein
VEWREGLRVRRGGWELFHRQNCGRWQLKAERAVPFTSGSARILRFVGRKGLNEASRAHLSAALRWYAHAPALLCCRPTDRYAMRACPGQYGNPLTGSFPQKQKSSAPGLLIGQRHFPWLSSSSVHPRPL